MARSKQVAVRRESSSEYFNKQTAKWEDASGKLANGNAKSDAAKAPEAGVLQLVIAVVGIYASL